MVALWILEISRTAKDARSGVYIDFSICNSDYLSASIFDTNGSYINYNFKLKNCRPIYSQFIIIGNYCNKGLIHLHLSRKENGIHQEFIRTIPKRPEIRIVGKGNDTA